MRILSKGQENTNYDTIIIPFTEKLELSIPVSETIRNSIKAVIDNNLFKGKSEQIYRLSLFFDGKLTNFILLGLSADNLIDNRDIFISFSNAFSLAKELKAINVKVLLDNVKFLTDDYDLVEKIAESPLLADYEFRAYKTDKVENDIFQVVFETQFQGIERALQEAKVCAESTIIARYLINQPPIYMTAEQLAEEAKLIGQQSNFEVEILEPEEIEKLGMNAFLAVGKGSAYTPRLIVMRYFNNKDNSKILGLIGKGLMYDSGGYNIKSGPGMAFMHSDMSGAAAVIGAIRAIALLGLKANVVGIIAACENRISSSAYLPGDILKSMSGKYIEMNNADAEGRLTLADAITYAIREEKVDKIVDIATLTGAVVTALGKKTAGILSNDEELADLAHRAAKISCEKVWRLPLDRELKYSLKSGPADIRNDGSPSDVGGGSIQGGLFLQEFVENKPWLHLDIAGTAWITNDLPYCKKGGVGFGTSLLYQMVKALN